MLISAVIVCCDTYICCAVENTDCGDNRAYTYAVEKLPACTKSCVSKVPREDMLGNRAYTVDTLPGYTK